MEEPVLLGLLDEEINIDFVKTSWETNKVGGKPDFIEYKNIPKCKECNSNLLLVCQIYCPVGHSEYHRTLFIFACTGKKCWNNSDSWAVIRSQLMDSRREDIKCKTEDLQHFEKNMEKADNTSKDKIFGNDDWGMDVEDWGDEDIDENKQAANEQLIAMVTDKTAPADQERHFHNDKMQLKTENVDILELNEKTSQMFIGGAFEGDEEIANTDSAEISSPESDSKVCTGEEINVNSDIVTYLNIAGEGKVSDQNQECELKNENTCKTFKTVSDKHSCQFVPYYVNVFEEPEATAFDATLKHEKQLLKEYAKKEGVDLNSLLDNSSNGNGENYEKSSVKHGDDAFYKFTKKVGRCPQQILRYQYNGKPLLMKKLQTKVPPCEHCGKQRQFELQLMPALVNVLKAQDINGQGQDHILEFGTVLVYTCSQSCWGDSNHRTEYLIVQSDPDQHLFKV